MTSAHGRPRLFVTGGSGFLGRHLVRRALDRGWSVSAPSSSECDIRDRAAVVAAVRTAEADVVAHLAYRRDDAATLVEGSRNVAEAAVLAGARLVHLSTDLVFAGRDEPYDESAAPDPIVDYGRHKLSGECAVEQVAPGAVIVRTSLLYGHDDLSPVQHDVVAAARGTRAIAFFTDEIRCPAHVDDVADAVLVLGARADVHGPLHVAGPTPLSRSAFARLTATALGFDASHLAEATIAESGLLRPARVVLDSSRASSLTITVRDPLTALAGVRPRSS